jgi:hypothetical protein
MEPISGIVLVAVFIGLSYGMLHRIYQEILDRRATALDRLERKETDGYKAFQKAHEATKMYSAVIQDTLRSIQRFNQFNIPIVDLREPSSPSPVKSTGNLLAAGGITYEEARKMVGVDECDCERIEITSYNDNERLYIQNHLLPCKLAELPYQQPREVGSGFGVSAREAVSALSHAMGVSHIAGPNSWYVCGMLPGGLGDGTAATSKAGR